MTNYINKKRMLNDFLEFVKIPSLSYKEGKFAKHLIKILKGLGCKVYVDNAGKKMGGDTGNIIAQFKGKIKSKPIALAAHMDTVTPGIGIKPVVTKNRVKSKGDTILAADCKAGIAIILEILKVIKERKLAAVPIEIMFTTAEEPGVVGASHLDYSKVKACSGIGIDWLGCDEIVVKAPAEYKLDITIHGRAAHGAMCPEKGISALEIAGKAISKLKMGWIDKETTCNLGLVKGGTTDNTVMAQINLKGDARSHNMKKLDGYVKYLKKVFESACRLAAKKIDGRKVMPKLDFKTKFLFKNFSIDKNSKIVKTLKKSAKKYGINLKTVSTNGCMEANQFTAHGIKIPTIGCGVKDLHTTKEELDLKQFFKCADIILDTVLKFRE
jgi:tripeptide aminopeptidase